MSTGRELARDLMCLCMLAMQAENNSVTIPLEMAGDIVDALSPSEEVKPCPFCGGEAKLVKGIKYIDNKETSIWQYVCNNKDCLIYEGYARYQLSEEEALKAWTRRWKDAKEGKDP